MHQNILFLTKDKDILWYSSNIKELTSFLGYKGENCNTKVCDKSVCHHGNCTDMETCQCQEGYSGDTCNNSECNGTLCQNGGLCMGHQCSCNGTGHKGESCEIKIDFCQNVTCGPRQQCINMTLNYTCTCEDGYSGPTCEIENNFVKFQ